MKSSVFSFLPDTIYRFHLVDGSQITGIITQVFDDGIEISDRRIVQDKIVFWYEVEE